MEDSSPLAPTVADASDRLARVAASYADFLSPQPLIRQVEVFHNRVHPKGMIVVDNRASGGELIEADVFTCAHCNSVVVCHPNQHFANCPFPKCFRAGRCTGARQSARASCKKCNMLVCDDRICAQECNSIFRSIDKMMDNPEVLVPWLPRGYNGELLFDRSLLEAGKVY